MHQHQSPETVWSGIRGKFGSARQSLARIPYAFGRGLQYLKAVPARYSMQVALALAAATYFTTSSLDVDVAALTTNTPATYEPITMTISFGETAAAASQEPSWIEKNWGGLALATAGITLLILPHLPQRD